MSLSFNKNYNKWFVTDVVHAIKRYALIDADDPVCVALSGGKDSVTLAFILAYLNRFSYLHFELSAAHIKTGDYDTGALQGFCEDLEIQYFEGRIVPAKAVGEKNVCYTCARLKRGAISDLIAAHGIRKVAYGHHATDVAETFFMNMVQNRKLGSFSPRVGFENNPMIMIRPMIYLEEVTLRSIHQHLNLPILSWACPYIETNIRTRFKQSVIQLDALFQTENFARRLVESLENIDTTNLWTNY